MSYEKRVLQKTSMGNNGTPRSRFERDQPKLKVGMGSQSDHPEHRSRFSGLARVSAFGFVQL